MNLSKIHTLPCYLFFFTVPFSVCTNVFTGLGTLFVFLVFALILVNVRNIQIVYCDKYIRYILQLFFLPMFIAIMSSSISLVTLNDSCYYEYYNFLLPTRVMNILLFVVIVLYIYNQINKIDIFECDNLIKFYSYGIFILLGLFGLWQICHIVFGVWVPPVETRSRLYFASTLGPQLNRVTSFADEPSYLAPFLIDGMILFSYLKKYIISILLLLICLFSFSFGGYMNLLFLAALLFIMMSRKNKIKYLCVGGFIFMMFMILFPDVFGNVLGIIGSRKELSSDFDPTDTSRTTMIVYPWIYLFQGNWISLLFGNGPSSFKYLHLSMKQPNGEEFHTTSNNLYTDIVYEGGLLSFFCILILFYCIWRLLSNIVNRYNYREIFTAKILLFHLVITSLYRGDYVSARFISIILIIGVLYVISKQKNDISNYPNKFSF